MNRATALAELNDRYGTIIADAGVNNAWLDYVVNDALRALGVAEADVRTAAPTGAQTPGFLALLRWAFWRGIAGVWANRVATTTEGGLQRARQQAYQQATEQAALAASEAAALGYDTLPAARIQAVRTRDPYGVEDGLLYGQVLV